MIIKCENCETRYLLPSSSLAPDGRRVRCSVCGHEWHQEYEESDYSGDEEGEDDLEPIPESVRPIPEGSSVPSLEVGAVEEPFPWASVAATILLIAAIFGALVLFRGPVTNIWPQSGAFYAALGMEPALPGEGLIIDQIKAVVDYENTDGSEVAISGFIMNLADQDVDIPVMKISLLDETDVAIATYYMQPEPSFVPANGEVIFSGSYELPDQLQSVRVGFTLNDMPEPVEPDIEDDAEDETGGE